MPITAVVNQTFNRLDAGGSSTPLRLSYCDVHLERHFIQSAADLAGSLRALYLNWDGINLQVTLHNSAFNNESVQIWYDAIVQNFESGSHHIVTSPAFGLGASATNRSASFSPNFVGDNRAGFPITVVPLGDLTVRVIAVARYGVLDGWGQLAFSPATSSDPRGQTLVNYPTLNSSDPDVPIILPAANIQIAEFTPNVPATVVQQVEVDRLVIDASAADQLVSSTSSAQHTSETIASILGSVTASLGQVDQHLSQLEALGTGMSVISGHIDNLQVESDRFKDAATEIADIDRSVSTNVLSTLQTIVDNTALQANGPTPLITLDDLNSIIQQLVESQQHVVTAINSLISNTG